jgi:hypothetical protein
MKLNYLVAVAVIAVFPLSSHAQQGAAKATNADAQRVVKIISADKAKLKIYCDLGTLSAQADEAEQKKDSKTVDALAKKMDDMAKELGPEYVALMDGLADVDPQSKEGQAIGETLAKLDDMCEK